MGLGLKQTGMPKAEIETRSCNAPPACCRSSPISPARPARAFRRPAPARRHRPRHRARTEAVPVRRAAVEPRCGPARATRGIEIARLHRSLKATMIYVTHDQVEAMTLADKIVVLNAGQIEQIGSPMELYNRPGQHLRRRLHRLAADELHRRRPPRRSRAPRRSASGRNISVCRARVATGRARSSTSSIWAPTRLSISSPTRSV